ncbi:MAG: hypothetical protein ACYC8T_16650 [Myxococcaceae bacterium]
MSSLLVGFRAPVQAVLLLGLLAGCGGRREEFIDSRVLERCDSQWPVCDQISGCLLGDASYVEGKFPGNSRLAVQIFEPSTVKMSFFIENVAAAGDETVISFYEDRCRSRVRHSVTGRTFVGEAEKVGWVTREADLSGVGDHLIEYTSDARASFLAKLEVIPTRLRDQQQ